MSDNTLPKPIWLPMGDQAIMLDYTGFTRPFVRPLTKGRAQQTA